jgi:hypothetical protein
MLFRRVRRSPKGELIASAERRRRENKYLKEPFNFIHYLAVTFRRRVEEQMLERQRDVIFDQVLSPDSHACFVGGIIKPRNTQPVDSSSKSATI